MRSATSYEGNWRSAPYCGIGISKRSAQYTGTEGVYVKELGNDDKSHCEKPGERGNAMVILLSLLFSLAESSNNAQ